MMKKRRFPFTIILGVFLILGGILIALLPTFSNLQIEQKVKEVNNLVLTPEVLEINRETETEYDFEAIENISATETLTNTHNYNPDQIIGQLVYPRLEMNLTLFNTLNNGNLLAGVTNMKANQKFGEGNYAIAGHHVFRDNVLFNQLINGAVGDEVRITNKQTIYIYEVVETKVVPPTAMEMISDNQVQKFGGPIVSLMACYPPDISQRWFVIGILKDQIPYTEEAMLAP